MGQSADLRFLNAADWEKRLRELFLGQLAEEVALILVRVCSGQDTMYRAVCALECLLSAIMACRHIVCAELLCTFEEGVELYLSVTEDIRVWSAAFFVLIEHIVHHPFPVLRTEVYKIERNTYLTGYKFSNKTVLLPLAVAVESCRGIVPVLHEKGKDIIALLLEHKRSNAGVHPSRKTYANLDIAVICHKIRYF